MVSLGMCRQRIEVPRKSIQAHTFPPISCISKRIEAQMGNHQPLWDNWREMCSTTPADYEGHHFDRPDSCERVSYFVLHMYSITYTYT